MRNSGAIMDMLGLITLALILMFTASAFGQTNELTNDMRNEIVDEWFMKGFAYCNLRLYNESLDAYNKAIELNPKDFESWNNKGIDLSFLGRNYEALAAFEMAASINKSYAEPWYNMGVAYDMMGDYRTAVQAYKKATQLNPNYQKAWINRNIDTDNIMARSLSCSCRNQLALV